MYVCVCVLIILRIPMVVNEILVYTYEVGRVHSDV